MRIAIIEDDITIQNNLSEALRKEKFAVDVSSDGEEGLYLLQEYPIDLAIVDLGLPNMSGIELIKQARKEGCKTPILILTARSNWQQKVEGLEAGADDYVVKPFEFEEILARVRALLRRTGQWTDETLHCPPIKLNMSTHQVFAHDQVITLTTQEFKLLSYLMTYAGNVIAKDKLIEHIYEDDVTHESNVLEVFIRRLRKKLDPDSTLNPIKTIRGSGYQWILPRQNP